MVPCLRGTSLASVAPKAEITENFNDKEIERIKRYQEGGAELGL